MRSADAKSFSTSPIMLAGELGTDSSPLGFSTSLLASASARDDAATTLELWMPIPISLDVVGAGEIRPSLKSNKSLVCELDESPDIIEL